MISRLSPLFSNLLHAVKQRLRNLVKPDNYALVANVMADLTRSREELILENAFLRQQLIILDRQVKRPLARPRERVLLVALASRLRSWKQALLIVQPATLIRWHQDLFRQQLIIRDRDGKFGQLFRRVVNGRSIDILLTPYRAPQANAICERFWGSLRRECLDFFILLGERHLYRVVKEYVAFYNGARPHQGIGQRIPGKPKPSAGEGKVIAFPVLGGLHHDYRRAA